MVAAFLVLLAGISAGICLAGESSADSAFISVESADVNPSSDVSIGIVLSRNPGIWCVSFDVEYDSRLTLKSISEGSLMEITSGDIGKNPFSVYGEGIAIANVTGTGSLMAMTFSVPAGTPAGAYALRIISGEIFDVDGQKISAVSGIGHINVINGAAVGDTFWSGGLKYKVVSAESGEASLIGYAGSPSNLAIPSKVEFGGLEYAVISVGSKAFYGCGTLRTVDLGPVKSVGMKAFANCVNMRSLIVSDTVKEFKPYAFFGCLSLKALTIPGDGVIVGTSAFSACKGMESISFTGTGAVIGTNAFYKNNRVATVDLSTVASIGFKAFPYCNGMVSLIIPSGVEVDAYAFFSCANLRDLVISEGIVSVSKSAFSECRALENVTFPSTLKSIGANAFYGVKFYEKSSRLDATADNLAGKTFAGSAGKLSLVEFSDGDSFAAGGLRYSVVSAAYREISLVGFSDAPVSLEVPSEIQFRGTAFKVVSVGAKAFYGCDSLASIDLGSVREIGMKAFANCKSLKDIDLGDSLRSIGAYAFFGCYNVEHLEVPGTLANIGVSAFSGLVLQEAAGKIMGISAANLRGHVFSGAGGKLVMIA